MWIFIITVACLFILFLYGLVTSSHRSEKDDEEQMRAIEEWKEKKRK